MFYFLYFLLWYMSVVTFKSLDSYKWVLKIGLLTRALLSLQHTGLIPIWEIRDATLTAVPLCLWTPLLFLDLSVLGGVLNLVTSGHPFLSESSSLPYNHPLSITWLFLTTGEKQIAKRKRNTFLIDLTFAFLILFYSFNFEGWSTRDSMAYIEEIHDARHQTQPPACRACISSHWAIFVTQQFLSPKYYPGRGGRDRILIVTFLEGRNWCWPNLFSSPSNRKIGWQNGGQRWRGGEVGIQLIKLGILVCNLGVCYSPTLSSLSHTLHINYSLI